MSRSSHQKHSTKIKPEHNPHKLERSPRDGAYDEKRRDNNTKRYKDQFHRYHLHALSTVVASERYTSWEAQKTPAVSSRSPAQRSPVIDRRLRWTILTVRMRSEQHS